MLHYNSPKVNGKYQLDDLAILIDTLIIDGFMIYYPSLEDPHEDWIFRSNLNFTVPLFDFLSIKLAFNLINDSNPNPDVGNNKTTTNYKTFIWCGLLRYLLCLSCLCYNI